MAEARPTLTAEARVGEALRQPLAAWCAVHGGLEAARRAVDATIGGVAAPPNCFVVSLQQLDTLTALRRALETQLSDDRVGLRVVLRDSFVEAGEFARRERRCRRRISDRWAYCAAGSTTSTRGSRWCCGSRRAPVVRGAAWAGRDTSCRTSAHALKRCRLSRPRCGRQWRRSRGRRTMPRGRPKRRHCASAKQLKACPPCGPDDTGHRGQAVEGTPVLRNSCSRRRAWRVRSHY